MPKSELMELRAAVLTQCLEFEKDAHEAEDWHKLVELLDGLIKLTAK